MGRIKAKQIIEVDIGTKQAMNAIAQNLGFADKYGIFDRELFLQKGKFGIWKEIDVFYHGSASYEKIMIPNSIGKENLFEKYKELYDLTFHLDEETK